MVTLKGSCEVYTQYLQSLRVVQWYGGRHPYAHDRVVHTCPHSGCKIKVVMGDRGGEVDLL